MSYSAEDYYRYLGIDLDEGKPGLSGLGKYTDAGNLVPGGRIDRYWGKHDINEEEYLGAEYKRKDPFLFDTELFRQHFDLRSVEFGNWVTQQERADFLYASGISFIHLAHVLGIKESQIGFGGRLSLAIGARNVNPAASAHYERYSNIAINLTKTKGIGCLAHEWAHCLDNMISVDSGMSNTGFLTLRINEAKQTGPSNLATLLNNLLITAVDSQMLESSDSNYLVNPKEIWARIFEHAIALLLLKEEITNFFLSEPVENYEARPWYARSSRLVKVLPQLKQLIQAYFNNNFKLAPVVQTELPLMPAAAKATEVSRTDFLQAYIDYKEKLEEYVKTNGGWKESFYIARTFLAKIEQKAFTDVPYRTMAYPWLKKGGTLLLRDQILPPVGYDNNNLKEYQAFDLLDTVSTVRR